MHVLIVDHASALGGAGLSLEALVTGMPSERCRYTVALPGPGSLVDRLRSQGLSVELVSLESWRWWVNTPMKLLKFCLTFPKQMGSLVRWVRFLRRLQPDLIHFNINRLVEPVVAAHLLGIPKVMHFRDIPSRMRFRFVAGRRGFYALMNLADCWIANSTVTATDIQGHNQQEINVIPNSINMHEFDQLLADEGDMARKLLASSSYHLAMIGGLNPWKNQADFVRLAIQILIKRSDVTFYLVGGGKQSPYGIELRAMVATAGVQEQVRFLGHIDCVPAFLAHLDILVHTMPYESFGRVFIEAMAARRPVIAFNNGGAAEIVVNDKTGLLVPVGDLEAMANAVCRLLDNPALREQMGEAGRERVAAHYTLETHCQAVADLYDELLLAKQHK